MTGRGMFPDRTIWWQPRGQRRRDGSQGWLLVKMRDEAAGTRHDSRRAQPESVRTGRTLEEIAQAGVRRLQ